MSAFALCSTLLCGSRFADPMGVHRPQQARVSSISAAGVVVGMHASINVSFTPSADADVGDVLHWSIRGDWAGADELVRRARSREYRMRVATPHSQPCDP